MFQSTITVFNYHKRTGLWYPSIIPYVDLIAAKASTRTTDGVNNADAVDILINCTAAKAITTSAGRKSYTGPKEYAGSTAPARCITFTPEQDFIFDGKWSDLTPIDDEDYDEGLYHALNAAHDGVYMISSAAFYSLLPHFEIGGR